MPHIVFEGIKYHYSARMPNSKEPKQAVVFIHGSGGSHVNWNNQISFLGRDYLALALDLPGHGLSGGAPCESINAYREFVLSFAERVLGIPFFLAGHSMGGAVALDFALSYPEKLAGLILVGTGSRLRVMSSILDSFREGKIPENMVSFLYRPEVPEEMLKASQGEMEKAGSMVFYRDMTACNNFDVSERLGEINIPALVITGDKDVMTPLKYGKFLKEKMGCASLEVIRDAGHMVMVEQPGLLNTAIMNFLTENSL